MITYKNLLDFVAENKKALNKDSLILILDKQTNNFKIYSHSGYLNIDTFQFTDTDGKILFTELKSNSGKVDSTGVISMWVFPQKCILDPSIEKTSLSTFRDVEYNNSFDRHGFVTIDEFNKNLKKYNFNDESILTTCGVGPDFAMVSGIELLTKPKFHMTDSYGHRNEYSYKYNCIAIVLGDEIKRDYIRESNTIIKFGDFSKKIH